MRRRIICVGNRFAGADAAGPLTHDFLLENGFPDGVEVVDGGLAGLDLLAFVDGAERVVFVDAVDGFADDEKVFAVSPGAAAALAPSSFDHAGGLPYLLRALPAVCEAAPPRITIVGIQGPPAPSDIARAAALAVRLVCDERVAGVGPGGS